MFLVTALSSMIPLGLKFLMLSFSTLPLCFSFPLRFEWILYFRYFFDSLLYT